MKTILKSASIFPQMVELRRTFHRNPELAFEEKETAFLLPYKQGVKSKE